MHKITYTCKILFLLSKVQLVLYYEQCSGAGGVKSNS